MEIYNNKEGATTNNNSPSQVNAGNSRDAGYMDMEGVQYESNFPDLGCPDSVPSNGTFDDHDDIYVVKSVSMDVSRVNYVNVDK